MKAGPDPSDKRLRFPGRGPSVTALGIPRQPISELGIPHNTQGPLVRNDPNST